MNVNNKTPINNEMELKMYFSKNVFFKREKQSEVDSKKPKKTVIIGKATNTETKKEFIYQKLIFFNIIF